MSGSWIVEVSGEPADGSFTASVRYLDGAVGLGATSSRTCVPDPDGSESDPAWADGTSFCAAPGYPQFAGWHPGAAGSVAPGMGVNLSLSYSPGLSFVKMERMGSGNPVPVPGAEFTLCAEGVAYSEEVGGSVASGACALKVMVLSNGVVSFGTLPYIDDFAGKPLSDRRFTLVESSTPLGYREPSPEGWEVSVGPSGWFAQSEDEADDWLTVSRPDPRVPEGQGFVILNAKLLLEDMPFSGSAQVWFLIWMAVGVVVASVVWRFWSRRGRGSTGDGGGRWPGSFRATSFSLVTKETDEG
jgi:hypothetical protein